MKIRCLYPGSFAANCYLLVSGTHAAVVDPSPDAQTILDELHALQATPESLLLTHGHFDHILSLDTLRERTGIPAFLHAGDRDYPQDAVKNAFYPFFRQKRQWNAPDRILTDGEVLTLGEETIRVLHTPGHTPGSVCFLLNGGRDILTGDTLFASSYGRCDLPGGDFSRLRESIKVLSHLDPDATVYPGHGEPARLGDALAAVRNDFDY